MLLSSMLEAMYDSEFILYVSLIILLIIQYRQSSGFCIASVYPEQINNLFEEYYNLILSEKVEYVPHYKYASAHTVVF